MIWIHLRGKILSHHAVCEKRWLLSYKKEKWETPHGTDQEWWDNPISEDMELPTDHMYGLREMPLIILSMLHIFLDHPGGAHGSHMWYDNR